MRLVAIPILVAALATPAAAVDGKGNFWVVGDGSLRCSAYAQGTPEHQLKMETWTAGYITAMNRATSNTYNLLTISVEEAKARLQQACATAPDKVFVHAVHEMLAELHATRVKVAPR
jgi:hypothetical protein